MDQALLKQVPDEIIVGLSFFKATPHEEGGRRYIYCEASNQNTDLQSEQILTKALAQSSDYFLKFGNIDIDHLTKIGHQHGISNPYYYEIGQPVEVRCAEPRTFVKGEILQGPTAEMANHFWHSLTEMRPAQRWYPSVAGGVVEKAIVYDAKTNSRRGVIKAVRWNNLAFSKEPVNHTVAAATLDPPAIFQKSFTAEEFAKSFLGSARACTCTTCEGKCAKGLAAGYGTSLPDLTGGAALRKESLDPESQYLWMAQKVLTRIGKATACDHLKGDLSHVGLVEHLERCEGLPLPTAQVYVRRLLRDVASRIRRNEK